MPAYSNYAYQQQGDHILLNYLKTADNLEEKATILTIISSIIEDQVTSYCNIIGTQ